MIQMCLKIALKAVRFSSKTVLKSVQNKAIYLGAMMSDEEKQSVIHLAKKLNKNIKIYQMDVNPDAFKLDVSEVEK